METEPLQIRAARPDDVPALVDFAAQAFRDTYRNIDDPADIERYVASSLTAAYFAPHVASEASSVLVAEQAGRLAGFALVTRSEPPPCVAEPQAVELQRLYLRQDVIGRGHGAALLGAALEAARRFGARAVWLGVYDRNERARAFYRRSGFIDVGTKDFVFGGHTYADPVMCAALP